MRILVFLLAISNLLSAQTAITVDYRPDGKGGHELVATSWQQHMHHAETNDRSRVSLLEDANQYWLVYDYKDSFFFPKAEARKTTTPDGHTVLFLKDEFGNLMSLRYRPAGEAKNISALTAKLNGTNIHYGGDVL